MPVSYVSSLNSHCSNSRRRHTVQQLRVTHLPACLPACLPAYLSTMYLPTYLLNLLTYLLEQYTHACTIDIIASHAYIGRTLSTQPTRQRGSKFIQSLIVTTAASIATEFNQSINQCIYQSSRNIKTNSANVYNYTYNIYYVAKIGCTLYDCYIDHAYKCSV